MILSICYTDGMLRAITSSCNGQFVRESFAWDGLALIQRGDEQFMNEPHVGGGNPVASSKGTSYFNDMLGTTVGSKSNGKYSAAALTAFGEDLSVNSSGESSRSPFPVPHSPFFTGKPYVEGLGHAFWMRNYRAGLAKWQTADPMGYPDGWNGTGPIKLLSCYTGSDSAVFCQGLANILGVSVYAADSIVWYFVVERTWSWWFHVLNNGRMEPDKSRPGNFIEFMPE